MIRREVQLSAKTRSSALLGPRIVSLVQNSFTLRNIKMTIVQCCRGLSYHSCHYHMGYDGLLRVLKTQFSFMHSSSKARGSRPSHLAHLNLHQNHSLTFS
uniref:Uncharacterized protein n=1 Tax=Cacopsylla melanoneura TaxID=428564 RepID=A0A8D8RT08_9HEMI